MDSVLRAIVIFVALWLVIRLSGRRALGELTAFDLVLLLIIAEASQQALLGDDLSITNGLLAVLTLVTMNVGLALLQQRWPGISRILSGAPTVIVEDGRPLKDLMARARVGEDEVLEAARRLRGLERMDQIKYAVLETSGAISIVPGPPPKPDRAPPDRAAKARSRR